MLNVCRLQSLPALSKLRLDYTEKHLGPYLEATPHSVSAADSASQQPTCWHTHAYYGSRSGLNEVLGII